MKIYLYYTNDNIIKEFKDDNILLDLYYKLAIIPDIKSLNNYIKSNNIKSIKDTKQYIEDLKKFISINDSYIPLYDAQTKNLYLINKDNVYYRVINDNYRLPDEKILNYLNNIYNDIKLIENKNIFLIEYSNKLEKNINYLKNYDLNVLKNTYNKILYETNPLYNQITTCLKSYYLPYQKTNPYYTKLELSKLSKIYNIDKKDYDKLCDEIKKYEIDAETLLQHQIYLNINKAKSYVQYYSLLGSFLFNNYLRDKKSIKDEILETHIINFYKIMKKAPIFNKSINLFRYIDNDNYLSHLKIGEIFNEYSYISTTRDPFYAINKNLFGFILLKIKIPINKEGVGLCLESYSLFNEELEILLSPGKLKLLNIITDDKTIDKNIIKIYEFDYIESINIENYLLDYNVLEENNLPYFDFYNLDKSILYENKYSDRIMEFLNLTKKLNYKRLFKTKIGNKEYILEANLVLENSVYHKFFYLQKKDGVYSMKGNEIYFSLINPINAEIELIIEIRNMISLNYIHRYTGVECSIPDYILLDFISHLSYHFKIEEVIIHSKYTSYFDIIINQLKNMDKNNNLLNEYLEVGNMTTPDSNWLNLYSGDNTYYSIDFIDYLYEKKKRFNNKNIIYIVKSFQIDNIFNLHPNKIINNIITDPIYKLQNKYYYKTLKDLYKLIHTTYPYYIKDLHNLINIYLKKNNIQLDYLLTKSIYNYKPLNYLYQLKKISYIPNFNYIYDEFLFKYVEQNRKIIRNRFRS
jgi:hypothetical protein